jgi:hypothetical protein
MRGRQWDDPEQRAEMERMFGTETFVRVDPPPGSAKAPAGEREDRLMGLNWTER